MFAHHVDLVDGGAGMKQFFVKGDGVVERDAVAQGDFQQGAAASADEEENEGVLGRPREHAQRRTRGIERFLVRPWMPRRKMPDAPVACLLLFGTGADGAVGKLPRQARQQCIQHGYGCLAKRDDADVAELLQIKAGGSENLLSARKGMVDQSGAFKVQVAVKRFADIAMLERVAENVARGSV